MTKIKFEGEKIEKEGFVDESVLIKSLERGKKYLRKNRYRLVIGWKKTRGQITKAKRDR